MATEEDDIKVADIKVAIEHAKAIGELNLRAKSQKKYIGEASVPYKWDRPEINGITKYCEQRFFYRSMSLEEANIWIRAFKKRCFDKAVINTSYQGFSSYLGYSADYLAEDTVMLEFDAPQFIIHILHLGVTGPKPENGDLSWSIGEHESNSKQNGDFFIIDKDDQTIRIDLAGLGGRLSDAYEALRINVLSLDKFNQMLRPNKTRLLLPYVFFDCVRAVKIVAYHEK